MKYITDPLHEWVVCIGVPYGTSLWQVGDSSEQNGSYKIELARAKENLPKEKKQMKLTIELYEIIISIKSAWPQSFACPLSNRKAVAACVWNPLNRNILLDATLCSTMTEGDKQEETISAIVPSQILLCPTTALATVAASTEFTILSTTSSTVLTIYQPDNPPRENLNY